MTLRPSWNWRKLVGLVVRFDGINQWKQSLCFLNKDGPAPGEVVGPTTLLKVLYKDFWAKQAHLDIRKEVLFKI